MSTPSVNPSNANLRHFLIRSGWLALLSVVALLAVAGVGIVGWLAEPPSGDFATQADWLGGAAEVMAGVLAVAMTVVAIVVELASNRYSHRISELFFNDPLNQGVLMLLVITTSLCVWTSLAFGLGFESAWFAGIGGDLLVGLISISVLVLIPYFFYVFRFLRPLNIVLRIYNQARPQSIWRGAGEVSVAQMRLATIIGDLYDVAGSALENHDRNIAVASLAALFDLIHDYRTATETAPADWHTLSQAGFADPDFVALSEDAADEIQANGTWLETKIVRQALLLVGRSMPGMPDIAHQYSMRVGELLPLTREHPNLFLIVLRAFNSQLRLAINRRDLRTGYFILAHYRRAGEWALEHGYADRARQVAIHMRQYGQLAFEMGQPFLLEVTAQDMVELIEQCDGDDDIGGLLRILLNMDRPVTDEESLAMQSLRGVRRAQVRLAAHFLAQAEQESASDARYLVHYRTVVEDLKTEKYDQVSACIAELENEDRALFWEFTERGANFSYLPPPMRRQLVRLRQDLDPAAT
ncbi:MAG: DUF2254 family protein [Pseudomonadota bacterium]